MRKRVREWADWVGKTDQNISFNLGADRGELWDGNRGRGRGENGWRKVGK